MVWIYGEKPICISVLKWQSLSTIHRFPRKAAQLTYGLMASLRIIIGVYAIGFPENAKSLGQRANVSRVAFIELS